MSFVTPFNFTGFGSGGGPASTFGFQTSLFNQHHQQPSSNQFLQPQPHPQDQIRNLPLPASIAQNYGQQGGQQGGHPQGQDYYGNPSQFNNGGFEHRTKTSNFETYQTFPHQNPQNQGDPVVPLQQPHTQPQRKRRPKNKQNRINRAPPPALTYSDQHIQAVENFKASQQQNPSNNAHNPGLVRVTPIQGPISARDGHLPVVPLFAYNSVKNGTFYQIPILWTALSYALGLELRGDVLRGLPCIKRLNQLFCPTAGNTYPLDSIERFIDENKALVKRMYGEFLMTSDSYEGPTIGGNVLRRTAREVYEDEVTQFFSKAKGSTNKLADLAENLKKTEDYDEYDYGDEELNTTKNNTRTRTGHPRGKRQTVNPRNGDPIPQPKSNKIDSCESTVEITTPYWAANSAGKVRAIVNTKHFEQAIQQEVCSKTSTKRCTGDCGCEQKYKWHRLLAYDPENDCKGIFADWFLFPSCCVCRCDP